LKPPGLEDSGMERYPSTKLAAKNIFYYVKIALKTEHKKPLR